MKENVLDVLMYLFETYVDTEDETEPDQIDLRNDLSLAGFRDSEIDRALDWLVRMPRSRESRHDPSHRGLCRRGRCRPYRELLRPVQRRSRSRFHGVFIRRDLGAR